MPRDSVFECSIDMSIAPAHSPPTAKPCSRRMRARRIGAAMPIEPAVGMRPMAIETSPMTMRVMKSIRLRPILSPKCPKSRPPMGREMYPVKRVR
nr:hypothetical protein [Janibacter melonis]